MSGTTGLSLSTIGQVAQPVADLDRSIEFYRDRLGGAFLAKFDPPGLAFFDCDGTRLLLDRAGGFQHPGSVIYFRVDDIDSACEALKSRGVTFDEDPQLIHRDDDGAFGTPGAQTWMAFFKDPDGNTLAIMSEVAGG